MKKVWAVMMTLAFLLVTGCGSGSKAQNQEKPKGWFVPWSEAHLSDHVMDWKDAGVEEAMRLETGIEKGDIRLSDVWELKQVSFGYGLVINDLSALCELSNLYELVFRDAKVADFSPLSGLPNLRSLKCDSSCQSKEARLSILKVTQLTSLHLIEKSDLGNRDYVSKLEFGQMVNLHTLTLKIMEIYPENIKGLNNVKTLNIETKAFGDNGKDFPEICDILSRLPALKNLSLYGGMYDVSNVAKLTNLTSLNLTHTYLAKNLIAPVGSLTNLEELTLSDDEITDVKALSSLTNLKKLDLSCNRIEKVKPLASLENLTRLNLRSNKIRDIKPLTSLSKLTYLNVAGNDIADQSVLSQFPDTVKIEY